MDKDEDKLLKEMMEINMLYLIFTKYANKLYPFDFGWKRYFKTISKFYYFKKMRKEIREVVAKSNLYDLIIDWLGLITYCKNTQGDEYDKFRLYNSKMNNNNYSYSLVESEDKKEVEYFEINLEYPNKFSLNIQKSRKSIAKENNKGMQITLTYSNAGAVKTIDNSTHFTVYNNGMVSSEYKELYKNIEKLIKEYIFFVVMHDLHFIIPKIVWRDEDDDSGRNIGS